MIPETIPCAVRHKRRSHFALVCSNKSQPSGYIYIKFQVSSQVSYIYVCVYVCVFMYVGGTKTVS